MEENLEASSEINNEISNETNKSTSEEIKDPKSEVQDIKENNSISQNNSAPKVDIKNGNDIPVKNIPKLKKELPIEKKTFQEFVNVHLIPSLVEEINQRGLEINNINPNIYLQQ